MSKSKNEISSVDESPIAKVPVDVLKLIFKDLDTKSLSQVNEVSKKFRTASSIFLHRDKMQHLKDTLLDEKKTLSCDSIKKICDELSKNNISESEIYAIVNNVLDLELDKIVNCLFSTPNELRYNTYKRVAQERYPFASVIDSEFFLNLSPAAGAEDRYTALVTLCVLKLVFETNPEKYKEGLKLINSSGKLCPIEVIEGKVCFKTDAGAIPMDKVIEDISKEATLPRSKKIHDASPELVRTTAFEDAKEKAIAMGLIKNTPHCTIL